MSGYEMVNPGPVTVTDSHQQPPHHNNNNNNLNNLNWNCNNIQRSRPSHGRLATSTSTTGTGSLSTYYVTSRNSEEDRENPNVSTSMTPSASAASGSRIPNTVTNPGFSFTLHQDDPECRNDTNSNSIRIDASRGRNTGGPQPEACLPSLTRAMPQTIQAERAGTITGTTVSASGHAFRPDLRSGVDEGGPTTASGRLKRNRDDELEEDDDDAPKSYKDAPDFPFKQASAHVRRAFDLYGNIHAIINDGIKRSAKEDAGENFANIQLDREFESYTLILNHIGGLYNEIIRLHNQPLEFRRLIRKVKKYADNARNNDNAGLKKDVQFFLTDEGDSILKSIKPGMKVSSKCDRGFMNDVMGRYLCPMNLDWDDLEIRQQIRDGKIAITAKQFPLLLFANCKCNMDDVEEGLGRNKALLRTVKYIFTGRSSAFSTTAGGKTTRAGNAQIAGCNSISPRIIAYGSCMLRFALSTQESWITLDGEFDMREFYWKVVGLFENSGEFGENLLAWWNKEVFGISLASETPVFDDEDCSLSLLQAQREAKRRRILADKDTTGNTGSYL